MSGLGVRHIQEMPLEPDLGAGYAWLTWDKEEGRICPGWGSDMSGIGLWYPDKKEGLDMSD
jgi:hypothetical protein